MVAVVNTRHAFERHYHQLPPGVEWSDIHGCYIYIVDGVELTGNMTPASRVNYAYQGYLWGIYDGR
jgi:hypothetical protein